MEVIQIQEAAGFTKVVTEVLRMAEAQVGDKAVVISLSGDLGAGKTTFTQYLAQALGVTETVNSPTFVLMKQYACAKGQPFEHLVHIDAYRIEDVDEMRVLGFAALLEEKGTIICIEWPEHIAELIPEEAIRVAIEIIGSGRTITIS